ncbi:MAG TPA: TetR/AcrR family transcriptional regulator [Marmoricola sp.]|jgi:TetR/AcrR family transcriptional regulator|nr:TetR/AcrR family transcriptional regulator [Marmoricola sp.]
MVATKGVEEYPVPELPSGPNAARGKDDGSLGERGARTRDAILDAARQLFLERGYGGTRISNITEACGISRAGFYTYFEDKHAVFDLLGQTAYDDILSVISLWENLPRPATQDDVLNWVRTYFKFMDVHGAFVLSSAHSAPTDETFRASSQRMQMRVAFLLGVGLRSRQASPDAAPEALGLATMALLDRSWYYCQGSDLPVDPAEMTQTVASMIYGTIGTTTA